MKWTVHGERMIYESPWVSLALADIEIPGGERFEHHVIRMPAEAAGTVVHDPDRGVLLLWRHRFTTDTWGWEPQKLAPLLAALKELLPWLHQWHNAIDPAYGDRISTTYQQFYETELHTLRLTDEDVEKIRMGATQ